MPTGFPPGNITMLDHAYKEAEADRSYRRTPMPHQASKRWLGNTPKVMPTPCSSTVAIAKPAKYSMPSAVSRISVPCAWPCHSAKRPMMAAPAATGRSTAAATRNRNHCRRVIEARDRVREACPERGNLWASCNMSCNRSACGGNQGCCERYSYESTDSHRILQLGFPIVPVVGDWHPFGAKPDS